MSTKNKKKKNKRKIGPLLLGLVVVFVALWIFTVFAEYQNETDKAGEEITFEIKKGEGTKAIAARLKEKGLIKNKLAFYMKIKSTGAAGQLKYGSFTIQKGASLGTVIHALTTGGARREGNWFTVPEGFTIEKIGAKLEKEGICSKKDFLSAVQEDYDYWFLESIPEDAPVTYRLQGFLFPDTYELGNNITPRNIVTIMLDEFGFKYTKEMDEKAKKMGKTTYEIVTEASIIERETDVDEERAMVAGVIENRLRTGMPLQMCPTVLYPLTEGMYDVTTVTYEDTRYDSLYNTYQNKGLPPGPIANPGLPCLEAALNPVSHNYFFYHTDEKKKDGSHIFTETYEEHVKTQEK